jgi:hypothetical protein
METQIGNFYNNLRKPVIYLLHRKYRIDKYTAEDIFQDTFFSFYKSQDRLKDSSDRDKFNWILRCCINYYNQQFGLKYRHKSKYIDKFVTSDISDSVSSIFKLTYIDIDYNEPHFMLGLRPVEAKIYGYIKQGYSLDEICKKFKPRKSYAFVSKNFNNLKKHVYKQI